jgi:hypothetical protein
MTVLYFIYIIGVLGFGGILLAIGRLDHSVPVLLLMAIGWPALFVGLVFSAVLVRLIGDHL